jgi:hypothetical protein
MAANPFLAVPADRPTDPADALGQLLAAEATLADVRRQLVAQLRNDKGLSWAALGQLLGVSKQGAMKVYAASCDEALRRSMREDRTPATASAPAVEDEPLVYVDRLGPHAHACPECGSEPGEPCRVAGRGNYTPGLRPHGRRVGVQVACPRCGAQVGQPCVADQVRLTPARNVHADRLAVLAATPAASPSRGMSA